MAGDPDPTQRPDDETAPLRPLAGTPLPARRVSPGDVLVGRYRVLRRIGSGGMGEVFEATDTQLERVIALKLVGPVTDDLDADAVLSEARKAARLRHAHIAGVHDAGVVRIGAETMAYIAMEIVPGAERIDAWAHRTDADLPTRLRALADVCDAVSHAHARGVVHGDLKPGNILIDADGGPRVIDFGVARALGVDEPLQASRGGTPGYAAPEQESANAPPLDGRIDVYALGKIARELCAGVRFPPGAERDFHALIAAATDPQRTTRLPGADAMAENLRAIADGRPAPVANSDIVARAQRALGEATTAHRWLWVLGAALFGCAAAYGIGFPLVHAWTPIDRWVVSALAHVPRVSIGGVPLEDMRVVMLQDSDDLDALAATEGLAGVHSTDITSWRRLHGRLMEKLAAAGPTAVVWDIRFFGETEFDDDLVRGIDRIRASGAEVVVGAGDWRVDADGLPAVSRRVLARAGWGAFTANVDADVPWRTHITVTRSAADRAAPSLALRAFGAVRHPGTEMDVRMDTDTGTAELRYWKPVAGVPSARTWVGERESVRLSGVRTLQDDEPGLGLVRGDEVGYLIVTVPEDPVLAGTTDQYSRVFAMSPQELRDRFGGCTVFVANIRAGTADIHPHPGGRRLPGVWAQACAMDELLRGAATRLPPPGLDAIVVLAFALAGGTAGFAGSGSTRHRVLFLTCLGVGCLGLTIGAYALAGLLLNSAVQAVGAIAAWEGSALGARLRRAWTSGA